MRSDRDLAVGDLDGLFRAGVAQRALTPQGRCPAGIRPMSETSLAGQGEHPWFDRAMFILSQLGSCNSNQLISGKEIKRSDGKHRAWEQWGYDRQTPLSVWVPLPSLSEARLCPGCPL